MGGVFPYSSAEPSLLANDRAVRPVWWRWRPSWRFRAPAWASSLPFHLALLTATLLSTTVVGAQVSLNYTKRLPAFNLELSPVLLRHLWHSPASLGLGLPFSLTLVGILLAHEMGH